MATVAWGWACVAFFGLGVVVFLWLLIRPQVLILDAGGFTVDGGLVRTPRYVAWRDVQGFCVFSAGRGGKMVGYNFEPHAKQKSLLTRINRSLGADAGLPQGWQISAEQLAAVLNDYRLQALGRAG
ncbi:hypothetical protein FQV39_13775 [Bosea sp. F3-2]|nr:hypothetical protein FQV39_13775 [Bosea sp. F3-2]